MTLVLRRTLVMAGVAVLLALAVIGATRATSPGQPAALPAAAAIQADRAAAGAPASNATATDGALAADLDAILAADTTTTAPERAAVRGELRRLAGWRRLVHATVVVDLKDGGLTTVQLDHGTISAVNATSLTIAEAGGGSVTVALGDETRVRRDGAKAAIADLKAADEVFVMSKVEADGTSAYLVVVPRR